MPSQFKDNLKVIIVAMVTALVTAAGTALAFNVAPAIAHGVKHAKFAHNADKVDGKHANQLRSIAEGRSYSFQTGAFQTVNATPENVVQFSFNAPRKGFAHVTYSHTDFALANAQTLSSWAELDPATDCDTTGRINATELRDTIPATTFSAGSATAIIPVSKGNHRLILCASAGADGVQLGVSSLTATFIPAGQVSISSPPSPRQGPGSKFGH